MTRPFVVACKSALVAAAALVVFVPALAGADALTSAQSGCVNAMNNSGTKVAATQGKENASCVKGVGLGKIDGTADACVTADSKGKVAKAQQKAIDTQSSKCLDPLPPYGYTGASTVNTAAVSGEIDLLESVFGSPVNGAIMTDSAGAACQASVVKSYEKLASTRGKEFVGCKKSGFKLATITDETGLISCITSDSKGKVDKARSKITSTIDAKCATVTLADAFPGCKTKAGSSQALSDCIAGKSECWMCTMLSAMDGLDAPCDLIDDGVINGTCAQCGNFVVDPGERCDGGGNTATCDSDCTYPICGDGLLNTPAGELCDDGNNVAGDGCQPNCDFCGDGVLDPGEQCDDGNLVDGDGCDPHCRIQGAACPTKGELTLLAGTGKTCTDNADCIGGSTCDTGIDRCVTATKLDTGWTGIAFESDTNDQVVVVGDLVCPGPAPTCGQCDVVGLEPDPRYCRCANDSRVVCNQPFKADAAECGGDMCNCYFGPPLPLSAGNVPACAVNRFAKDVSGTANVDTGAGQVTANLKSMVYLGLSLITPCPPCGGTCTAPASKVGSGCGTGLDCDSLAPCNSNADCTNPGGICQGSKCYLDGICGNFDPVANDGVRGGRCFLGDNDGQSCDVMAPNSSFPAPGGGGVSLDCFPPSGLNVGGTGLTINLKQTTGSVSLPPAALSCNFGTGLCPCGECAGDTSVGCTSNADCGASGPCQTNSERPNGCDDGVCTPAGGGYGECMANPLDKTCDGIVRANGEGFISCQSDADCSPVNIGIPAGSCTLTKARKCFLDPITATGVQDANEPLSVATFCVPKTSNGGLNTTAGLPGPGRIKNQSKSRLFCANNPANLYTPGVGCP
jgi:cysteine-rich repeat protein